MGYFGLKRGNIVDTTINEPLVYFANTECGMKDKRK